MADEEEARSECCHEHEDVGGAVDHDRAEGPRTRATGGASEPVCSQEVPGPARHDVVARDRPDDELKKPADRKQPLMAGDPPPPNGLE